MKKKSYERDQIGEKKETLNTDIEVLKLGKLSLQKNIDSIEKESNERNWMDMSDDKDSDERYQISKKYEEKLTDDIEVLKLGKLSSQKNRDTIENESDEINRMHMGDDRDSDERYPIGKNDEERLTDDIEVLKLGKYSSQKNIDNIEKYSGKKIRWI